MARTQAADYEERKDAILDHAAALFARKGFLGTSVLDIARACGASKSLLYHYYPSKEDVLAGVMSSHIDVLLNTASEVLADATPAEARLRQMLHRFLEHYAGAADRQKVLLHELDNLPPEIRKAIVLKQKKIVDAVQSLLVHVFPDKLADPATARVKTMLIFGMINWTSNWFDQRGKLTYADLADMALEMALAGREVS